MSNGNIEESEEPKVVKRSEKDKSNYQISFQEIQEIATEELNILLEGKNTIRGNYSERYFINDTPFMTDEVLINTYVNHRIPIRWQIESILKTLVKPDEIENDLICINKEPDVRLAYDVNRGMDLAIAIRLNIAKVEEKDARRCTEDKIKID